MRAYDLTVSGSLIVSGSTTLTGDITYDDLTATGNIVTTGASKVISGSSTSTGSFGYLNVDGQAIVSGMSNSNLVNVSSSLSTRVSNLKTDSGSFSTRVTRNEATGSSLTTASSSFSTRVTRNEATGSSLTSDSGSFSLRIARLETSGSITESSASFSTRITAVTSSISALKTDSGSFSSRLDNSEASGALMNQDLKTSASPTFTGGTYTSNLGVSGSLTVKGMVTAEEFHTEFVSASIVYKSGSTKFGDDIDDTHSFTGSINQSGSFNLNDGNMTIADTLTATTLTGTTIKDFSTISGSSSSTGSFGDGRFADKVGIGTTSPGAKLSILGPNATGTFFTAQNDGAAGAEFKRVNAGSSPYNHFLFHNGNVGIGNTAPPVALTVEGNISGSGTGSFGVIKTGDIELENERGHWKIIEESEYLSIYNVKTDKKFKFVLEEIE